MPETGKKIKYWRLEPVYDEPVDPNQFITAAVVNCMVTGEMLDGMGGGGYFMSNKIFEQLSSPASKVVISAKLYDLLTTPKDYYEN